MSTRQIQFTLKQVNLPHPNFRARSIKCSFIYIQVVTFSYLCHNKILASFLYRFFGAK